MVFVPPKKVNKRIFKVVGRTNTFFVDLSCPFFSNFIRAMGFFLENDAFGGDGTKKTERVSCHATGNPFLWRSFSSSTATQKSDTNVSRLLNLTILMTPKNYHSMSVKPKLEKCNRFEMNRSSRVVKKCFKLPMVGKMFSRIFRRPSASILTAERLAIDFRWKSWKAEVPRPLIPNFDSPCREVWGKKKLVLISAAACFRGFGRNS